MFASGKCATDDGYWGEGLNHTEAEHNDTQARDRIIGRTGYSRGGRNLGWLPKTCVCSIVFPGSVVCARKESNEGIDSVGMATCKHRVVSADSPRFVV